MNVPFTKIVAISTLLLASLNAEATIIIGNLSYDTNTHLITGANELTYVGWFKTLNYNFEEALAATSEGGLFEEYHIANSDEAKVYYAMLGGLDPFRGRKLKQQMLIKAEVTDGSPSNWLPYKSSIKGYFMADTYIPEGDQHYDISTVSISEQFGPLKATYGATCSDEIKDYSRCPELTKSSLNSLILAATDNKLYYPILVSGSPTSTVKFQVIPAPATSLLLGFGLMGLGVARRKFNQPLTSVTLCFPTLKATYSTKVTSLKLMPVG